MIVFRRMLKRTVGTAHEHYRMLRMPRSTGVEPPDDAAEEPVTTEPSGPTTTSTGSSNTPRA